MFACVSSLKGWMFLLLASACFSSLSHNNNRLNFHAFPLIEIPVQENNGKSSVSAPEKREADRSHREDQLWVEDRSHTRQSAAVTIMDDNDLDIRNMFEE